jgi:hypothetical protein
MSGASDVSRSHPPHVTAVHADSRGQVVEAGGLAGFERLLPAMRLGDYERLERR